MGPTEKIVNKMDTVYDEMAKMRKGSREQAFLAGQLHGLAWAVMENCRLTLEDALELADQRGVARSAGLRQPSLPTWLAHRGTPSQREAV